MTNYARAPVVDPSAAETVFDPSNDAEGNWVGAPSVHVHEGRTYLAVRWRGPQERGYSVAIYERNGEDDYQRVSVIDADELGAQSLERPALLTDPHTGQLKLYLSVEHGENDWTIQKLDDVDDPGEFDPATSHDVLTPAPGRTDAETVKDPYVLTLGDRYYMFYAGHDGEIEQAHLATSTDGDHWERASTNPVLESAGWHDFFTRISCVVPAPDVATWLVFYEGSSRSDYRPVRNLRTGIAVSNDLRTVDDVTTGGPKLTARRADQRVGVDSYDTFRYVDVLETRGGWELFFEVARPDGSFALRRESVNHE